MIQMMVLGLMACGGGSGLVSQATSAADAACACADKACAMKEVAAFNKVSYQASEEKKSLDDAGKAALKAATDRMSACRDKLP